MGLLMDNLAEIHVPSGPTTASPAGPALDGLSLTALIDRKDNVEAELKALGSVLDSHGVRMTTSLTTLDGFPRDDVDVAQIRVTRARIIALRNDWKELMDRIEKGLHEHHANLQASETTKENTSPPTATPVAPLAPSAPATPFAKVNRVEEGSPAHEAGLKAGDQIRAFGSANWTNHERLQRVGQVVQQNLGRPILVQIIRGVGRDSQELQLRVTPRQGWGGRGTLGCHILPI